MTVIKSNNPEETAALAHKIAGLLKGSEIIAFFGGLGMGKTTFTRSLAEALGSEDDVSSPTFAIVNEYSGKYKIYHFDMYRITSWEDLYSTGFFDYIETGVLVIEWSENIENALPEGFIRVEIKPGEGEKERIFEIEGIDL